MRIMSGFYENVKNYISQHHMLEPGDGVVAGVSGGADSVCLLLMLIKLRDEWIDSEKEGIPLRIKVIHVNHMIRGAEADRDENFVVSLCEKHDIEYQVYRKNIPEMAEKEHLTEEEAGRIFRYKVFSEEAEKMEIQCNLNNTSEKKYRVRIAVAHNKDDLAETVIYNMIRGSSLLGLAGIKPVRDRIIRPLLMCTRSEIEKQLQEWNQSFIQDSTNLNPEYSRNKIRIQIMPLLNEINEGSREHLADIASDAIRLAEDIDREINKYDNCGSEDKAESSLADKSCLVDNSERCLVNKDESSLVDKLDSLDNKKSTLIHIDELLSLSSLARGERVLRALEYVAGRRKDITREHIDSVIRLSDMQSGKRVDLPYNMVAVRNYDGIVVSCKNAADSYISEKGKGVPVFGQNSSIVLKKIQYNGNVEISKKEYTKMIDCDKINSVLVLRTPEPEDFIVINESGGRKKLSRLFTDFKLDRAKRGNVPVVADGNEIVWVVGMRLSERYKITDSTETIMEISYSG